MGRASVCETHHSAWSWWVSLPA